MEQDDMQDDALKRNGITDGIIWKEMIIFFFPLVIGSLVQQLYNTVDAVIVGRFIGKIALAAVGGSAANITFGVMQMFLSISAGATVSVAQNYGAKRFDAVHRALHTAYALTLAASVIVTVLALLFSPHLLRLMETPEELMAPSILYMNIYFGGIVFQFVYNMGSAVMRAVGDSRRPLIYLGVCSVVNIVLDILFVIVFKWGITGAAVATVAAQAVSAILVTISLMRDYEEMKLRIRDIRFDVRMLRHQLRTGLPGGMQAVMYTVTNIIIQGVINGFGTDVIAAWAAYFKVDIVFWAVCGSFGVAATTFCGQNYGAGHMHRVKQSTRTALVMSSVLNGSILILMIVFARPLLMLFLTEDPVIDLGVYMMHCLVPFYMISVFLEILNGALRGLGNVLVPTAFTMAALLLVRMPWLLFYVVHHRELFLLIVSYPLAWASNLVALVIYYLYITRRKLNIR